jgi:hypothetical protein
MSLPETVVWYWRKRITGKPAAPLPVGAANGVDQLADPGASPLADRAVLAGRRLHGGLDELMALPPGTSSCEARPENL